MRENENLKILNEKELNDLINKIYIKFFDIFEKNLQ